MRTQFPILAGRAQFFNPIRAVCPNNGRKSDLSGAPSMARITVDVVFRWIGRSYLFPGLLKIGDLDRWDMEEICRIIRGELDGGLMGTIWG